MIFHIYKAGELFGQVEADQDDEAARLARAKFGRSKLFVIVSDAKGARALDAARRKSIALAEQSRASAGRPKSDAPREAISLKVDPRVLKFFRSTGPGWQTRMHAVLAEYVSEQTTDAEGKQRP